MNILTSLYFGFYTLSGLMVLLNETGAFLPGRVMQIVTGVTVWALSSIFGVWCFRLFSSKPIYKKLEKTFLFSNIWVLFGFTNLSILILAGYFKSSILPGGLSQAAQNLIISPAVFAVPGIFAGFLFCFIKEYIYTNDGADKFVPYISEAVGSVLAGIIYIFFIIGKMANYDFLLYGILGLILIAWVLYRPVARREIKFPFLFYIYVAIYLLLSMNAGSFRG